MIPKSVQRFSEKHALGLDPADHGQAKERVVDQAAIKRSRRAKSNVRSSARASLSNSASISVGLITSGGHSEIVSPARERSITPSSSAKATARAPTPARGSNDCFVALFATSS